MRSLSLLSVFTFLLALAAAWPWPEASHNGPQEGEVRLQVRAESSDSSKSESTTATSGDSPSSTSGDSSSPSTTAKASRSGSSNSDSSPSSSSDGNSGSNTHKTTGKDATKTTKGSSHTSYDPRLPAGGVSMITPNALAQSQFYKIGNWVTFAWNYTSVSSMPTAVDILASCSANQATYTIGLNQTVHPTQTVLWDTKSHQDNYQNSGGVPLLTEKYTLIIYDAASSISATPQSGYLAVAENFIFGMYSPQAYTPLADWQCATCSGAMSSTERQTLSFLLGMGTITVLTFTYFANSFGVF